MILSLRIQTTTYSRLSDNEREEISIGLASGELQASIALRLCRSKSTISREIERNRGTSGYRAFSAGRRANTTASSRRGGKRRLLEDKRLRAYVLFGLRQRWSPREIVRRMETNDQPWVRLLREQPDIPSWCLLAERRML